MKSRGCLLAVLGLVLLVSCRLSESQRLTPRDIERALRGKTLEERAREMFARTHIGRLGDVLTEAPGIRTLEVEGFGLVDGLQGRGTDVVPLNPAGLKSELLLQLARLRIPDRSERLRSLDTAPVRAVIKIPPLAREGMRLDVELRALGNPRSLQGGLLLPMDLQPLVETPGGTRRAGVVARAEGRITLDPGRRMLGEYAALDPHTGYIPAGAVFSRPYGEIEGKRISARPAGGLFLLLRKADLWNVYFVSWAINQRFQENIAQTLHARAVTVQVPAKYCLNWQRFTKILQEMDLSLLASEGKRGQRVKELGAELRSPDALVRRRASLALEAIGSPALGVLEAACQSPDLALKLEAARALMGIDETRAIPVLKEIYARGDEDQQAQVAVTLSMSRRTEGIEQLMEMLSNPSLLVRFRAVQSLVALKVEHRKVNVRRSLQESFDLIVVDSSAPPALVGKVNAPRQLLITAPNLALQVPFSLIRDDVDVAIYSDAEGQAVISYSIMGVMHKEVEEPQVRALVVLLDKIGLTVNDIFSLVYELGRSGAIPAEMLWLAE